MYAKLLLQRHNMKRPSVIKDARRKSFIAVPAKMCLGEAFDRPRYLTQLYNQARISSGMFKNYLIVFDGLTNENRIMTNYFLYS